MSKVIFKELEISNFMAFGKKSTTVLLNKNQLTAITGRNLDTTDTGNSRNGAGKTTFYNAFFFALFGSGIDKVKADEFINLTNGKGLVVRLSFSIGDDEYEVVRGRKPNKLEFTMNGTSLTLDSMSNTDKLISKTIGYTHQTFLETQFSDPTRDGFFSLSPTEQRSVTERIMELDVLMDRAEAVKQMAKETKDEITIVEKEIAMREAELTRMDTQLERLTSLSEDFETTKSNKIRKLQDEIRSVDVDKLNRNATAIDRHDQAVKKVDSLQTKKTEMERDLSALKKERDSMESSRQWFISEEETIGRSLENKLAQLKGLGKIDKNTSILETFNTIRDLSADIRTYKNGVKSIDDLKESLEQTMSDIESHKNGQCPVCGSDGYQDVEKMSKMEQKVVDINKEIEKQVALAADIKEFEDLLVGFKKQTDGFEEQRLKDQIKEQETLLVEIRSLQKRQENLKSSPTFNQQTYDSVCEQIVDLQQKLRDFVVVVQEANEEKVLLLNELEEFDHRQKSQITRILDSAEAAKRQLVDEEETVNRFDGEVEILKAEVSTKLDEFEAIEKTLEELNDQKEHLSHLQQLLTSNKSFIRRNILGSIIPFLNKKLNGYLASLDLSHTCVVNDDLSVTLKYMNKDVSFYMMSRGERLRLNLAANVAFRDVMRLMGKETNLYLLDEYLDSALDDSGLARAKKLIEGSADNVFLITHKTELLNEIDNKLVFEKINGFSRLA